MHLREWEIYKMSMRKDRPDKYDDVLVTMHTGAWFGFYKNADYSTGISAPHTYDNFLIHAVKGVTHDKPTKDYLDTELAKMQAAWDAEAHGRNREHEYPDIGEQLDMMYKDQINDTTTWRDSITAIKNKYRKP